MEDLSEIDNNKVPKCCAKVLAGILTSELTPRALLELVHNQNLRSPVSPCLHFTKIMDQLSFNKDNVFHIVF